MATPTGTTANIVGRPYVRRLVEVDGWFYLFYYGTSSLVYASTDDPACAQDSFGSEVADLGVASSVVNDLSVCTDGKYIHMTYLEGTTLVKYRRGSPSGGTITWDAAVTAATSTSVRIGTICVTSDSHVLISFTGGSHCRVVRNANTTASSTWSNDTDFPSGGAQVSSSSNSNMYTQVTPQASGKFYVAWVPQAVSKALGRPWTGSGWGSIESDISDTNVTDVWGWSLNSWSDEVWIGWTSLATYYYIRARRRSSSGTWGSTSPYLLNLWGGSGKGGDNISPAISINKTTGDVFFFWRHTSNYHLFSMKFDYGKAAWDSAVDWGAGLVPNSADLMNSTFSEFRDQVVLAYAVYPSSVPYVHILAVPSPGGGNVGPAGGCMMFGGVGIV